MSHDVRAPLLTIQGFAHELSARETDADAAHLLSRITANAQTAQLRLNAVVHYSRLMGATLHRQNLDMQRLFAEVAAQIKSETSARAVDIDIQDLPAAQGDEELIRQLARQLLTNAIKFAAAADNPTIIIRGSTQSGTGEFSVTDNGPGFDPSLAPRLFALFRRLHRESEYPGVGAGLAIAKLIVSRHDGRIGCHASPGKGATFSFTLPSPSILATDHSAMHTSITQGRPLNALIVEDSTDDAHMLARRLKDGGWHVNDRRVETEQEFRDALAHGADIVLADYTLPAFSVPRILQIRREIGSDVPVIVVTGSINEEVAVDCIKRGAADYLLKDRLARLPAAVDYAIGAADESRARRIAEQSRDAAIRELDHRVKNNLAVVLGLIQISAKSADNINHYRHRLTGRIQAIEIAHSELAARHWQAAGLRSLLLRTLLAATTSNPHRMKLTADRLAITVDESILVCTRTAPSITTTINELATNALSHGAWSSERGRVTVEVQAAPDGITIDWIETDGPPVTTPKTSGEGLRLIRDQLPHEVGGKVDLNFDPAGLRVRIEIPSSSNQGPSLIDLKDHYPVLLLNGQSAKAG